MTDDIISAETLSEYPTGIRFQYGRRRMVKIPRSPMVIHHEDALPCMDLDTLEVGLVRRDHPVHYADTRPMVPGVVFFALGVMSCRPRLGDTGSGQAAEAIAAYLSGDATRDALKEENPDALRVVVSDLRTGVKKAPETDPDLLAARRVLWHLELLLSTIQDAEPSSGEETAPSE